MRGGDQVADGFAGYDDLREVEGGAEVGLVDCAVCVGGEGQDAVGVGVGVADVVDF